MRWISYEGLKERGIRFSRVHLRRLSRDGKFPPPISVGENRVAWDEGEVDHWMQQRVANREIFAARRSELATQRRNKIKRAKSRNSAAVNESGTAEVE